MTNASSLPSSLRDNAVASASKLAHRSGASMTPSSETRVDSISLRIVVLLLEWLISWSEAQLQTGPSRPAAASPRQRPPRGPRPSGKCARHRWLHAVGVDLRLVHASRFGAELGRL